MLEGKLLKFDKIIFKLLCWISIPMILALCIVTFLQVFTRYALNNPLYWSEELSRYLFIWLTFMGIGIAAHRRSEMSVSFFVNLIPAKLALLVEILATSLVIAFLAVAIHEGVTLAIESHDLPSIALEMPWSYIYMSVPAGFSLLILQYISRLIRLFIKLVSDDSKTMNQSGQKGEA